ncbi:MAG: DUF536 domain-containing protein [Oscillospiraceae bacterium]|nr:DUF536 domain-containing protein [Oscillospiraceae bacterium]MBQ9982061.1 DUF536 domain-containing protein [Oscillospiraceae bacterium]
MEQTEQQYVTIKEFATLANVTTQAVYKRLNQTDSALNKYVQYNGKMKLISKEALELFVDSQPLTQNDVSESAYDEVSLQTQNNLFSAYFDATLKVLSDQINSKDAQIKELMNCNMDQNQKMQEQLMAKDKQITELQRLIDQQQQLHRAEQEQFRLITTATDEKNEKKGFFKRLFHKKEEVSV